MENTSDSLMPRPLLLCLKSEKIVCYSVPDNTKWEALNEIKMNLLDVRVEKLEKGFQELKTQIA